MGVNFCGFRRRPNSTNRSCRQDSESRNCGLTSSVMKFLTPKSLWAVVKIRKRQEKQEVLQPTYKNESEVLITLEDLIMSSPGFNISNYTNSSVAGSEMQAHKQSSSRKIHPSFDGEPMIKEELSLKSMKTFTVEVSMERKGAENGGSHSEDTSFCRMNSGKLKKKVSFRSPEVADVFVLDRSPEICGGSTLIGC